MSNREIIAGPLTLYLAPVGTAFPAIGTAPTGDWVKVGTGGARNYDTSGVTVMHNATYTKVRTDGATGPLVAFIDEEDLMFRVRLIDFALEQLRNALEGNAITTVAAGTGTAGTKTVGLSKGPGRAAEYALIAEGPSPYLDGQVARFLVPRCFQSGNLETIFRKSQPAGVSLEFTALENASASNDATRFGTLTAVHALPL